MLLSSIFTWTLLGASLILCTAFLNQYAEHREGIVQLVFGLSLVSSLAFSGMMLVTAQRFAVPGFAGRTTRGSSALAGLVDSFDKLAQTMGVRAQLTEATVGNAFSLTVRGINVVALSPNMARSMSCEEVEAVLAHELSHIKNHDSLAKGLARMARLAYPFDPVIRLVEAATHRERELLADRASAEFTGKPLALASALLKACTSHPLGGPGAAVGLCVGGNSKGLLKLYPNLDERIDVLIELSKRLSPSSLIEFSSI